MNGRGLGAKDIQKYSEMHTKARQNLYSNQSPRVGVIEEDDRDRPLATATIATLNNSGLSTDPETRTPIGMSLFGCFVHK